MLTRSVIRRAAGPRSLLSTCLLITLATWQVLPASGQLPLADQSPVSPHHGDLLRHRDTPTLPALRGDGTRPMPLSQRAARTAQSRPVVFGFLPYWISSDYFARIDYGLLTHTAAFSVEVNSDGSLGDDHGWPWTGLVNEAHRHGVRVILTATLFSNEQIKSLMELPERKQRFFRAIRDKVLEGNADGVNIDFEGSGANGWPRLLPAFLRELTDYMHAEIPGSEVSFDGPPVDWSGRWDFAAVAASCDYVFIMGYDFAGSWSGTTGATAPLTGGSRNLTTTLTDARDYGDAVRDMPHKLILGVPYFGCQWKTQSDQAGAAVTDFVRNPRIVETIPGLSAYGRLWDERSQTPWYAYLVAGAWEQVWADDSESLRMKYELALDHGLRGIGVWALGYEDHRPEPWRVIEEVAGRRVPTAIGETDAVPRVFQVAPAYPNPFNASTTMAYRVAGGGRLEATLHDAAGQRVRRFTRSYEGPAEGVLLWDGTDDAGHTVATGVYLVRFRFVPDAETAGQMLQVTRKLVLLR